MSEAKTRSEVGHLEEFLQLRSELRGRRVGRGGSEVCQILTSSLDGGVRSVASEIGLGTGLAVVATGGYGRSELSLFSDVDLMLLHDVDDPSAAATALFRPLWDAGLRLGHAVRSAREAATAARERFDTFTTLLTGRLIAGDGELFERLSGEVASVIRARPLRRYLVAEEQSRRQDSPYLRMAADLKNGRGGLRTLHGFEWERRREELIGRFSTPSSEAEARARETLLRIRNGIHAIAGRPYDLYAFDLREPVARWLESAVFELGEELVGALRTVDRLADQRWPELADPGDPLVRKVWNRLRGAGTESTKAALTFEDVGATLRSGHQGRLAWERLRQSDRLSTLLPAWDAIETAPQLAPFHEHPVVDHLWRTVDEMQALVDGSDGHYSAIAQELGSPDTLTLAAFLHDIGKAQGGNHSEVGAKVAAGFCAQIGCPPGESTLIVGAVRHHLLLSETATRRDLDDPAVVAEVAEVVGGLRLLQILYLLTVADSRATGEAMWSQWKATLVRTLFLRCAALLGADEPSDSPGATTRESVLAAAGSKRRAAMETHLDSMPEEYLRGTPTDEILWHLETIEGLERRARIDVREGETADTVIVVGRSHPRFRRLVAEALAANGIDVLEARLAGRSDGIVVDSFRVRDDRTGGKVAPPRWERVEADIEAALGGQLDTESKLVARAEAYAAVAPSDRDPQVSITIDPASDEGLITIKCSDRIGRLAEILGVLLDRGLEIRLAKLDSRAGEVVDTFHIPRQSLPPDTDRLARDLQAFL